MIDVTCQANFKMKLCEFVKYYYGLKKRKILNIINLEFSHTRLCILVETPKIVCKLSWAENISPVEFIFQIFKMQK